MKKTPNKEIASEAKTRKVIMGIAKNLGCHEELNQLFIKYDNLLRNCTNEVESKHIKMLALQEINNLLEVNYNLKAASLANNDVRIVAK